MLYKENKPYDSYLPKDCCPRWKQEHALKELAAEAANSRGKIYFSSDTCLVLDIPKPIYPPYEILNCDYERYTDNPFDIMDVGMKIAILTLLRENVKVYLENTLGAFLGLCFSFEFRESSVLKVETLHVLVRHQYELNIMGTKIKILNSLSVERLNSSALEFMTRDKEKVYLETKIMEYMDSSLHKKIKPQVSETYEKVFRKICTPEMRLYYSVLRESLMHEWFQKGGIICFVKDYIQKNQIDLIEIMNNEKFSLKERRIIQSYFVSDEYLIKNEFYDYLFDLGYKEITPSGYPSTITNYIKAIDEVVKWERLESWEQLISNIPIVVKKYSKGGQMADFGNIGHSTIINALKRFYEFVVLKKVERERKKC